MLELVLKRILSRLAHPEWRLHYVLFLSACSGLDLRFPWYRSNSAFLTRKEQPLDPEDPAGQSQGIKITTTMGFVGAFPSKHRGIFNRGLNTAKERVDVPVNEG